MFSRRFVPLFATSIVLGLTAAAQTARCAAWTAESGQSQSLFGGAVASAGDVNGDGYDDVLVGAPGYDSGVVSGGRAYLYLGSATGLASSSAWEIKSDRIAYLGSTVASAGDVNGDGFDDVIIGAPYFSNGEDVEGKAEVYLGSPSGLPFSPAWTVESDLPLTLFGSSVASAGDVNGDGFDDVLVGAIAFSNDQAREGRASLYLGSAAGLELTPAWEVEGNQKDSWFSAPLASAGDVNGDGFDDVIVGAQYFTDTAVFEGRVVVYLGSSTGLATTPAWQVDGFEVSDQLGIHLGASVATAGDVNGDGFGDVIVGAPIFTNGVREPGEGCAFVFLGSAVGLDHTPAWRAEGNLSNATLGNCVATAGDVNGDGFGDVIVGASQYGLAGPLVFEGRALVYLGSSAGLSTQAAWKADGAQAEARFGAAVAAAGDVNGDGFGDVIVGAYGYDGTQTDEGRASVYVGSPLGLARSFVFAGDGVNADRIEPMDALLGMTWSAPLTLAHPHGRSGLLTLIIRTDTVNGPSVPSPVGGRMTETLVSGPLLATVRGTYDGFAGDIPPQLVPQRASLLGVTWAAQYIVFGGGHADLSQAVWGVVDSCP